METEYNSFTSLRFGKRKLTIRGMIKGWRLGLEEVLHPLQSFFSSKWGLELTAWALTPWPLTRPKCQGRVPSLYFIRVLTWARFLVPCFDWFPPNLPLLDSFVSFTIRDLLKPTTMGLSFHIINSRIINGSQMAT